MAKKFEKLKIELSKKNERIFREMYQFTKAEDNSIIYKTSFDKFINDWIETELLMSGFE